MSRRPLDEAIRRRRFFVFPDKRSFVADYSRARRLLFVVSSFIIQHLPFINFLLINAE
jgi:hypothetical protein